MDKEKAREQIEQLLDYHSLELSIEDWTGTGEDDLCVTVNHQGGDHITHLYLTGEDDDIFLYIGDDVIEPLTEANVWRVLGFDAMHSAEVLADEIDRLKAEVERLRAALKPFAEAWTSPEPRHPLDEDYHEAARALGMAE